MNGSLKLRKLAVGAAMLAMFAMPLGAAAQEAAATEVSGAAFGISADGTVMIEPTPSVVLPAEGGTERDEVLQLNESGVTTGVLTVTTTGDLEAGTANSVATVNELAVSLTGLENLLTATTIEATSDSSCEDGMAQSVGDVAIEDLEVLGVEVAVTDEENQEVSTEIPGVGSVTVVINERIGEDGDLTVNALRVTVDLLGEEQEIVVASAHSDIVCAAVAGDNQQDDKQDDTAGDDQQGDKQDDTAGDDQQGDKQDDTAGDDQQGDKQDDTAGDDQQGELPKTGGAPVSALYSVITLGGAALAGLGAYAVRRRQ